MGSCETVDEYENDLPKHNNETIKTKIKNNKSGPRPLTEKEAMVNIKIDYIMNGLYCDLFPANFSRQNKRCSWGVAISLESATPIHSEVFAFNDNLKKGIFFAILHTKKLRGDYGNSSPPQLILNYYHDGYILNIECYNRDGQLNHCSSCIVLSKQDTRMYVRTIIEEGYVFYDLYKPEATYDPDKNKPESNH